MSQTKPESPPKPLKESARDSITYFLAQLEGASCTDLHHLVMSQVEEPLLRAVMEETGGNQSRAAAMLGLSRGTLRTKLRYYKLI